MNTGKKTVSAKTIGTLSSIKILSQFIKDLSFENFSAQKHIFSSSKPEIKIDIKINTKKITSDVFEVSLLFFIEAVQETKKVFLIELNYGCLVTILETEKEKTRHALMVQCPNLMFPFIRKIIYDLSREGGFAPLNLDQIDFENLYQSKDITAKEKGIH